MRNYNQTSYDTVVRSGNNNNNNNNNRSRSQNHYYIQANEFQKRYQNSLMNSYKLNTSRNKCPPCCNQDNQYQSNMTFKSYQQNNYKLTDKNNIANDYSPNQYYQTSYFNNANRYNEQQLNNQDNSQILNLQKSKRYLQQLIQKGNNNFRNHKQKAQTQLITLQKLLQNKNQQISQLNKEINRLKKISLQTTSKGANISYIKQDQSILQQIQNKQIQNKQIQRKYNRVKQQNSYYRQDIQIKNKQIQQLKSKYKLKQQNDQKIKTQLQKQNQQHKIQHNILIQKILKYQKLINQKQLQLYQQKQIINHIESQLQIIKNKYNQSNKQKQSVELRYIQKTKSFQNQFKVLRQRSKQKDMLIQNLISKINCIQSQIDFFKQKFTNLLMEIQRQQRQSAMIFDHAISLKQQGIKFYQATSRINTDRIRQSQLIQLESHTKSRLNTYNHIYDHHNVFDNVENKLTQSIGYNKVGLAKQTVFQSLSPKHFNRLEGNQMVQSGVEFIHKFPSLNMSISPIRTKY